MRSVTGTTLCALALFFAACGGDDTEPANSVDKQEQTTPSKAAQKSKDDAEKASKADKADKAGDKTDPGDREADKAAEKTGKPIASFETRNGKGMLVTKTTAEARAVCDAMRARQSTIADGSSTFPIGTDGEDYSCDLKKGK